MQRLIIIVVVVYSLLALLKYRYRVLNAILRNRWLRRLSVSLVMQIPAVRDRIIYQILR